MRGLKDQVVIVAGAASGIGAATAGRLTEEGAKVVVGDIDEAGAQATADRLRSAGGEAVAVRFDIADDASVAALIDSTLTAYGGLSAVHLNAADLSAGTLGRDSNALDVELAVWDRTLAVNLRGYLLVTRHALPELLKRGGGALVYTSSGAAFAGEPERPSYAASKAGINALVRHVASRWGRKGIRANGIAPGLVLSGGVRSPDEKFRQRILSATRSPRLGEPEDVAAMAAFLISDDAAWVNGQILGVDGGTLLR